MFFNDLKERLHKWSREKRESIFVIDGPSQIGKTHFIKEYLQYSGLIHLYIDVRAYKDLLERIMNDSYRSADDFYTAICFEFGKTPIVPLILLIFDGIEYCPKLRQFFKTLVKHSRINVLAITCGGTGPLHYKDLLVPSEEFVYHMQPLTFYDFMVCIGQRTLADHLNESITNKKPISEFLSNKIYSFYKTYNLIGGYPLTISQYKKKNDIYLCIETNKYIFQQQFEHALKFMSKDDAELLFKIRDNFPSIIKSGKYNAVDGISIYKMKQLLSFLEEEYVINVSTALDIRNQSNQSSAKKVFFSHQCFYYAICGFDKTNYFDGISVDHDIVLTDFYFNQRINNKPLNFALERSSRYFVSDALIVNNTSIYIVEIKNKRLSIDLNNNLSEKSEGMFRPGVLLFNSNVYRFDSVFVLPPYCSCFLNKLFTK